MAEAGLDDILISYNLLGEEKMARLGRLMERASVTVAADNPTVVAGPAARRRARRAGPSTSSSSATPAASAPASRPRPRRSRSRRTSRRGRGSRLRASCSTRPRTRWPSTQKLPRRGDGGRARGRPRGPHGLDRRHAERRQSRQDQGRDRAPRRHLRLQRPHDARLRRRRHGRSARFTSSRRSSAGPARSAASSTPARRR